MQDSYDKTLLQEFTIQQCQLAISLGHGVDENSLSTLLYVCILSLTIPFIIIIYLGKNCVFVFSEMHRHVYGPIHGYMEPSVTDIYTQTTERAKSARIISTCYCTHFICLMFSLSTLKVQATDHARNQF